MTDDRDYRGRVGELTRDGVIVVEDHLDRERCDRLASAARDLPTDLPEVDEAASTPLGGTGDVGDPNSTEGSDDGEETTRQAPDRPRIVGDPDDSGIVTVDHAHLASEGLDELREDFVLETLVNGYTHEYYAATSLAIRIREGPTDPEPYHVPGENLFLAVVYLSDCTSVEDGPFAYIQGSQEESSLRRRLGPFVGSLTDRGTGEATFYEASDGTAHTGPAGTAIVANGRGYQRFLPVGEDRESVVAIVRFEAAGPHSE